MLKIHFPVEKINVIFTWGALSRLVQPDGSHEWDSEEEVWGGGGSVALLVTEGVGRGGDIEHWERRQQRQRQPIGLALHTFFISSSIIILSINTHAAADRWDSSKTLLWDFLWNNFHSEIYGKFAVTDSWQMIIITDWIFKRMREK